MKRNTTFENYSSYEYVLTFLEQKLQFCSKKRYRNLEFSDFS